MPEQTLHVIEAFSPILAQKKYRQFWSMEVRVKDDKAYFIDRNTDIANIYATSTCNTIGQITQQGIVCVE